MIGLGYVGLPLVREFCHGGFAVTGFDVDQAKIKALSSGRSYIKHIPSSMLREMVDTGRFHATADMARLSKPDAIIIWRGRLLSTRTKDPDLQFVEGTAHAIAKTLRAGQLVSLESTTYPGTTRDVVQPILEATGLKVEKGLLAGLLAGARGPGPQGSLDPHDPQAGRWDRPTEPGPGPRPVQLGHREGHRGGILRGRRGRQGR